MRYIAEKADALPCRACGSSTRRAASVLWQLTRKFSHRKKPAVNMMPVFAAGAFRDAK